MKALPGPEGGVVAALLTGEQTAVDKDIAQAMRDSGLAHILSISGLHIVFVVALVMGLVRYGIALVPRLALRIDAKKVAAVLALMAALFYTALAGAPGAGPARLRHGGLRAARHPARPHGLVAAAGRLVGGHRAGRRAGIADRRVLPDVVRRRGRPDRGWEAAAGWRRACTSAPTVRAIAGCGGVAAPSRPASPPP